MPNRPSASCNTPGGSTPRQAQCTTFDGVTWPYACHPPSGASFRGDSPAGSWESSPGPQIAIPGESRRPPDTASASEDAREVGQDLSNVTGVQVVRMTKHRGQLGDHGDIHRSIDGQFHFLSRSTGPADLDGHRIGVPTQAEMQRQIILVSLTCGSFDLARE